MLDSPMLDIYLAPINQSRLTPEQRGALTEAITQGAEIVATAVLSREVSFKRLISATPRQVLEEARLVVARVDAKDAEHADMLRGVRDALDTALHPLYGPKLAIGPEVPPPGVDAVVLPDDTVAVVACPTCSNDTTATEELCEHCQTAVPLKGANR